MEHGKGPLAAAFQGLEAAFWTGYPAKNNVSAEARYRQIRAFLRSTPEGRELVEHLPESIEAAPINPRDGSATANRLHERFRSAFNAAAQLEAGRYTLTIEPTSSIQGQDASGADLRFSDPPVRASASDWTGVLSRKDRLGFLASMLPQAQASVNVMISLLPPFGSNNGPPLDEVDDWQGAAEKLRELHTAIGEMLALVDTGRFDDESGFGLAADIARTAEDLVSRVRNDPVFYGIAATVWAGLAYAGFPGTGKSLSDFILSVQRRSKRER